MRKALPLALLVAVLAVLVVACGGTIAGMGFLLAAALSFGLAEGSQNGFTPETLQGLSGLSNEAQVIFSGGIGIMLFGLGLLGEYVGRIYEQVRGRPRYLVEAVLEQPHMERRAKSAVGLEA